MDVTKKFSVLISVYIKDNASFFDSALQSIWCDTTLKPSQVVLVKDGPLNGDLEKIIEKWKSIIEKNLTIVVLEKNSGLATALNEGLFHCHYDIVARMDSDDISLPNRFQSQIDFLTNHPETSILGSAIEEWDESFSTRTGIKKLPENFIDIKKFSKFRSPINHPSVIFRKEAIINCGGYPNIYPEDYLLWCIAIKKGYIIRNQDEVLLKMRCGDSMMKRRGFKFLKGEIKLFLKLYEINHINTTQLILNIASRSILRLSPLSLKKLFYKKLR